MGTSEVERRDDDVLKGKEMKYDPTKLQYYTMSHRLRGFAEGLGDSREYELIVPMLNKAAALLEHAWDEYQSTLPEDQRIGG